MKNSNLPHFNDQFSTNGNWRSGYLPMSTMILNRFISEERGLFFFPSAVIRPHGFLIVIALRSCRYKISWKLRLGKVFPTDLDSWYFPSPHLMAFYCAVALDYSGFFFPVYSLYPPACLPIYDMKLVPVVMTFSSPAPCHYMSNEWWLSFSYGSNKVHFYICFS